HSLAARLDESLCYVSMECFVGWISTLRRRKVPWLMTAMRACLSQVVLPEARTFHTDPRSGQIDCPFVIGLTAMDHRALAPIPSFASIRERSGYLALQFSKRRE